MATTSSETSSIDDYMLSVDSKMTTTATPPPSSSAGSFCDEAERQIVCTICKEDITKQNQQVHYGAVACFSCRAFFRRAQGLKRPFSECKRDNQCLLTVETRRFCGPCRLSACIRAGMKPSAVLSEEQKKHRFRKMLKRKREEAEKGGAQVPTKKKNWNTFMSEYGLSPAEALMMEIHRPNFSGPLDVTLDLLKHLYSVFKSKALHFAETTPDFLLLGFGQRELVLRLEIPNIVQYLVCRHFTARSGEHQILNLFPDLQKLLPQHPPNQIGIGFLDKLAKETSVTLNGRRSFLINCYLKKFIDTIRCLLIEVTEQSDDRIKRELLLSNVKAVSPNRAKNSPLELQFERERLMCQRILDLSAFAKAMFTVHDIEVLEVGSIQSLDSLWILLARRVKSLTLTLLSRCGADVSPLPDFYQRRVPVVMSLFLVRLSAADTFQSQLEILSPVLEYGSQERPHDLTKLEVFVQSCKKPLMQRALQEFEALISLFQVCFADDETFRLFVMLALFWTKDEDGTTSGIRGIRKHLFSILAEVCHSTEEFGITFLETCRASLEQLDTLNHLCNTFASEGSIYTMLEL